MSEENLNYAEFGVSKKAEGKNKLQRILLVSAYVLFAILYATIFISVSIPQVIAILPIFVWMFIFFTWKHVKFDYEYKIEQGEMIFLKAYTPKKKKELFRFKVRDAKKIVPIKDFSKKDMLTGRIYDFRGSSKSPASYMAVVAVDGKDACVYFEATIQTVKLLHRLNDKTIVSGELKF